MVERLPRVLKVLGLFPSKAKQNHKTAAHRWVHKGKVQTVADLVQACNPSLGKLE